MRNLEKISFPYRATTHLAFLHVVGESGAWERQGLDVNYNWQISKSDAHRAVASGEVEFVGGNHISTYGHRARGDQWVYLGQTLNAVHSKLAVRSDSGINSVQDLRGKKIGTRGNHPGLNDWLFLKQRGLDVDRGDIELIKKVEGVGTAEDVEQLEGADAEAAKKRAHTPLWTWVRDGKVDAALLMSPAHLFAEEAGLKIIDIEPLPMIWYTTISSSLPFVQKNPDLVDRFLKGLIEGIHFFKTQPEKSIKIIQEHHTR
jgi:ABC-type nitrate/sulfonate/bicarbonate transport system substrate-binding protein